MNAAKYTVNALTFNVVAFCSLLIRNLLKIWSVILYLNEEKKKNYIFIISHTYLSVSYFASLDMAEERIDLFNNMFYGVTVETSEDPEHLAT